MTAAPVVAYFDGLCELDPRTGKRNPGGYACGGWVVQGLGDERTGCGFYMRGDGATNNVAEYRAALDALRTAYRAGQRGPVLLRGDSQLVIKQAAGIWRCQSPPLQDLLARVRLAVTYFESVTFEWVPREQNEQADHLSRVAYNQALQGAQVRA